MGVSDGLSKAGYKYLNLDDCWMDDKRDKDGRLQGDSTRFPSGIKSLADYIHSKGMKFGIYSDRGSKTCQGKPASLGNEAVDAQTFAEWGVDYLKEDNCYSSTGKDDKPQLFKEFGLMRDALNKTGRPVFFSVCGGGDHFAGENISYYATDPRGGAKLANAWRISGDVNIWTTLSQAVDADNGLEDAAGPGGFNDPDMLLGSTQSFIMTPEQSRTQFNLLAVLMAPLLIGADVRNLPQHDFQTYTNSEVIAVNQDSLMKQGRRLVKKMFSAPGKWPVLSVEVWARELSQGRVAMVFLNYYNSTTKITCDSQCWAKLPYKTGSSFQVRDMWIHASATKADAVVGESYDVTVKDGSGVSKMLVFKPKTPAALIV